MQNQEVLIERATVQDGEAIRHLVMQAYSKYIDRIGKEPAPMKTDYPSVIAAATQEVYVLREHGRDGLVVGSILLSDSPADDSIKVDNLVVDPKAQGRGYGRLLLDLAVDVAKSKGRTALTLFTNEKMYENLSLYPKMGFVETERRVEDSYRRVYFRKAI